jgi:uncharacterized Ntn-hydrolase superfamily protein
MCVGVGVPWLSPGIGAIATQASINVHFGPIGISLLQQGLSADKVVEGLIATDEGADSRQLAVVDRAGRAAAWTGEQCIPVADHKIGSGYAVQANMMLNPGVVKAMASAFEKSSEDFAGRLLAALNAAQKNGGDIRGMQSAALKIVASSENDEEGLNQVDPIYDLRVDEHADPLKELVRLVKLRLAVLHSRSGLDLLEQGEQEQALTLWYEARNLAPELEELAFWQSVRLADNHQEYGKAAAILKPVLETQANREQWVDLIHRIQDCGILEDKKTADGLLKALGDLLD